MKTAHVFSLVMIIAVIFTAFTPAVAYARPETSSNQPNWAEKAKPTVVKLTIGNKTGGALFFTLTGTQNYFFVATNAGKSTFQIVPGKYVVTLWSSNCPGKVTKTRTFKGGSANLGTWVCRH